MSKFANFAVVVAIAACATHLAEAAEFKVRPGAKQADVKAPPKNDSVYTYRMVSVVQGKVGARFLVRRKMDRKWTSFLYWKQRFTFVAPKEKRQGLANYLQKIDYADVRINKQGVEFLSEKQTDLKGRMLKADETMKVQKKYQPNDCDRVIGTCKFTVHERGKEALFLVRTSSFKNGLWRDVERYDPARDPKKRDQVRDERVFSVDANGVIYDMRTTRHTGRVIEVFQMTRLTPALGGRATPAAAAIPKLPKGANTTLSETCSKPGLDLSSDGQRWTLKQGDKKAFKTSSRDWKIHCGNGFTGTACPANSHVRAIYGPGRVIFGCYKGAVPAKPFG